MAFNADKVNAMRARVSKLGGATLKSYNRNVAKRQKIAKAARKALKDPEVANAKAAAPAGEEAPD